MSGEQSKEEKEKALDARIAAIRAKNEKQVQRQKEVERDRRLAEKQNQSITTAPKVKPEKTDSQQEYEPEYLGEVRAAGGRGGKEGRRRLREEGQAKERSGGRLAADDGPPPDPGYRFLADRFREGSEEEGAEEEEDRPVRRREENWNRGGRGGGKGDSWGGSGRGGGRGEVRGETGSRGGMRGVGRGRGSERGGKGGGHWGEEKWGQDGDHWGDDRVGRLNGGGGVRGGGRGERARGSSSNGRGRDEHIQPFTQRRGGGGGWTEGQDWGRVEPQNSSPRHKVPRQPFTAEREEWDGATPTATVSPRRQGEEVKRPPAAPSSPTRPPQPLIKPLLQDQVAPPAPFKESSKPPPLISQTDLGFQQAGVGSYNKQPFPLQQQELPSSNWKCPDPGCRQINGQRTLSCTKCGIAYKAASDYISNFACERVKQEYQARGDKRNSFSKPGQDSFSQPQAQTNGFSSQNSNPPPPQPMVQQQQPQHQQQQPPTQQQTPQQQPQQQQQQQQQGKDWTGEQEPIGWGVGQEAGWGGPPLEPNLVLAQQLVGVDPNTVHQYNLMLAAQQQGAVQVPSFPPPAFFPPQQGVPPQQFFSGAIPEQFQQFQQDQYHNSFPHSNIAVYPQPPVQYQQYPTIPPHTRPAYSALRPKDPALVIPLHLRAPAPLALRRPQQQEQQQQSWRPGPDNKHSRNSLEKEAPPSSSSSSRPSALSRQTSTESTSFSNRGVPPRFQRQREASQQQVSLTSSQQQASHTSSQQQTSLTSSQQPGSHTSSQPVKPPSMIEMQSGSLKKNSALPPPASHLGLLIFSTANILSHLEEQKLAEQLQIPVTTELVSKLEMFEEKAGLMDPSRDWLVVIHCLGSDARNIALKRMSDAEKASEADVVANRFCDVIEERILGVAEHICVMVSMLLPRCDFQEKPGMANPNNVRKVINVQITSRLYEHPRVSLINSDKALEWGDDVDRLNTLMEGDGYHLTEQGFSLVLATWQQQIANKMKECNFKSCSVQQEEPQSVEEEEEEEESKKLVNGSEEKGAEDSPADDDDTVNDPFGSYTAPVEIVSPKTRTLSFSEVKDDLDDDALPSLELVTNDQAPPVTGPSVEADLEADLAAAVSQVALEESGESRVGHTTDEEEEFHDVDDGGFIEDSYCGSGEAVRELPSMLSLEPSTSPLASGHFLEDSYLPQPPTNGSLEGRSTVEFVYNSEDTVKIAGDFNNWEPQVMEKGAEPRSWQLLLDLPMGRYQYKYLIGDCWEHDPKADTVVNKEGATNNLIVVTNDLD